jgi:carbamate kinase
MRIIIALGGNALLRRSEPLTAKNQRNNVKTAAKSLSSIVCMHNVVISHGNGPQVGLLALQGAASNSNETFPLDILDAETEGMIGYLIEQELRNLLPEGRRCATLLTQIEVDPKDPAFMHPTKPIGPVYSKEEAHKLAHERGWSIALDGKHYRRVVPSPRPKRIFELSVIELLINHDVTVICAGGGGIPVICWKDGTLRGVEAVIDKDLASSLLARKLKADTLLMLTDVDAVYQDWGTPAARPIRRTSPEQIGQLSFAPGSMGPKVEAAIEFVKYTGADAAIGALEDAKLILQGNAGTVISRDSTDIVWWE